MAYLALGQPILHTLIFSPTPPKPLYALSHVLPNHWIAKGPPRCTPDPHWLQEKILSFLVTLNTQDTQTHWILPYWTVGFLPLASFSPFRRDETPKPPPSPTFPLFTSLRPSTEQQCASPAPNAATCPVPVHNGITISCSNILHSLILLLAHVLHFFVTR